MRLLYCLRLVAKVLLGWKNRLANFILLKHQATYGVLGIEFELITT